MRLREVFRYEFAYRLRSGATWMYAAFLFLLCGGLVATAGDSGVAGTHSPQRVAQAVVLFPGLFGLLVSAALFGDAAIRDVAAGMDPLVYTTRLRKREYLGGRFLAALAINALVVLGLPLGFFAGTIFLGPTASGANGLAAYVQPVVLFVWPNLVVVGALLFAIGTLARQVIPVYLGVAGVFVAYVVAANYWSAIAHPMLWALADPLGINAFQSMTRYWTPVELQTRLIGFPAMLVWNRLLWLAIAAAGLVALHHHFRFTHAYGGGSRRERRRPHGRERRRERGEASASAIVEASPRPALPAAWRGPADVPHVAGVFGRRTRVRQVLAIARQSLTEVASGRAFQIALVAAVGLVLLWGWNAADTAFDTSTWPVTGLVVDEVLSRRSGLIPWLVIALYAGELVWKDREVGAAEIVDAVPVSTAVALLGRFVGLVLIILIFHAAFMAGGILLQALQGYYTFEPWLYVRVLFGLNLASHVLLAALALTVHVLVNQKYVGHIIVLPACVLSMAVGPMDLSYLAVFNSGPRWTYSDMNGFGPFLRPFVWFKLYWSAWALLLGVVATLFWVRGREPGLRGRLATARARLRGGAARLAGAATALIVALGAFIFYNTNILNANPSRNDVGRAQAEYERRYGGFKELPQPAITTADLRIEVYPEEGSADLRGAYRLENRTTAPIDTVHVVVNTEIHVRSIAFDRAAAPVAVDEETGYRIFALERALQPGDALRLSFDVAFRPRGFRSQRIPTAVAGNGTYFDRLWLPFIGYQPAFELSDATPRRRFGLAPRPAMAGPDDVEARRHDTVLRNEDQVQVEAIVGTSGDQTPLVPGLLRRSWSEHGRRYAHYATDGASPFGASVFSARYAVREDRWHDVALQIFHHPTHAYALDRMLAGMKASLDYYTKAFGPYQFRALRVVEIPPYSINGRAFATTIAFSEQNFINRSDGGRIDHTFFGTAHEVAHSWWGGQVRRANVRGQAFLSEGLSNYSAMMVTETVLGPQEARRVYDFQMDRYLTRRTAFESDVPVIEVEDHPHIAYGKGAVALYALREQIGAAPVNAALRRLLEKYRDGRPPYATARDLLAELRAATPESLQYLLTDLFETVTLWEIKAERAVVAPAGDGRHEVTLDVTAKKVRADRVGHETETPMDDIVDIGLFASGDSLDAPLSLQRHRIRSGRQTIRITVPREPARAGVDPWRKLIERERQDNLIDVTASGASSARANPTGANPTKTNPASANPVSANFASTQRDLPNPGIARPGIARPGGAGRDGASSGGGAGV